MRVRQFDRQFIRPICNQRIKVSRNFIIVDDFEPRAVLPMSQAGIPERPAYQRLFHRLQNILIALIMIRHIKPQMRFYRRI